MIETGTVKEKRENGRILVSFPHLQTEAECPVVQSTTGDNSTFILPSVGTQVVCWLESGKNIVLGAIYSESETVPGKADPEGELHQIGETLLEVKNDLAAIRHDKTTLEITADKATVRQDSTTLELSGGKASLRNDQTSLKALLKEILSALKSLTVSTAMGPSGTPLPPTVQAVIKCEQLTEQLLK